MINKVRNWLINKSYCHTENGYEHNVFTAYIFGIYEAVAYSLTGDLLIQVPLPVQPSLISKPLVFNSQFLDPSLCKRPFTSNFSQQSRRSTLREELQIHCQFSILSFLLCSFRFLFNNWYAFEFFDLNNVYPFGFFDLGMLRKWN